MSAGWSTEAQSAQTPNKFKTHMSALAAMAFLIVTIAVGIEAEQGTAKAFAHTTLCADGYSVQPGDSLSVIAQTVGVPMGDLATWNLITDLDLIHVGDRLCVIAPVSEIGPTQKPAPSTSWKRIVIPSTNSDSQPNLAMRDATWAAFGEHGIEVYTKALMISRCESNYKATAHRTDVNPTALSGDLGAFQINSIHVSWLRELGIIDNASDLFDPYANSKAAAALYERAGNTFADWYMSDHCHGIS